MLNVPKDRMAAPIELHGLSTQDQRWWRRPIYAGLKCASCKSVKRGAMYEYGVSKGGGPIKWDGKVYCNTRCLPDDTAGIRRERYSYRQPVGKRKMEMVQARAQERRNRLFARYLQLKRKVSNPEVALAQEEGISKQAISRLIRRAITEQQSRKEAS